jgi:hypothetical protein
LPDDIAPEVGAFDFYIQAFRELSTCRASGFGLGPIPFTAIVEYSKIYNVEDFDDFLYFIRLMDSKILELESNKQKKQDGQNGRKPNKSHKG